MSGLRSALDNLDRARKEKARDEQRAAIPPIAKMSLRDADDIRRPIVVTSSRAITSCTLTCFGEGVPPYYGHLSGGTSEFTLDGKPYPVNRCLLYGLICLKSNPDLEAAITGTRKEQNR